MNPIKALLLFLFLLVIHFCSYSQGQANWWYFGDSAGVSFSTGSPVAVNTGKMYAWEGCATISDNAGNLLFYTNGINVWNKSHVQMPNGFGLLGNTSSSQSAIIVPRPGSNTIYYIFTTDGFAGPNGLRYSIVDLSLSGGLGNVTTKNTLLYTPTAEKLTAVMHCNRKDIWVISHDWNSNQFRVYLVTSAGVSIVPFLTSVGSINNGANTNSIGYLKSSPDGTKLAYTNHYDFVEVVDFNNSTGIISNPVTLTGANFTWAGTLYRHSYGVEFSPDGTKLYISHVSPTGIVQVNLCAGSNAAILASGVIVGNPANANGAIQLGPDKKIYYARFQTPWLGVINNPNTLGLGCNYVDNGVPLAGRNSLLGLPNFISSYLKPELLFTTAINCLTVNFTATTVNASNCFGSGNVVLSKLWNFGDPASGVNNTSTTDSLIHTFTSAGTYNVKLVLNYACGADTIIKTVTVTSCVCILSAQLVKGTADCTGCSCKEWIMINATGGTSPYSYSWPDGYTKRYKNQLCAGVYSINIKDKNGCNTNISITTP